jgi:N-acetylmuramoyl-L-alanine amidase
VVFKVQITTSSKEIELNATNFKGLEGVEMYMDGGMYKYTYGKSNNFDDAVSTQDFVRQKGFTSAFVVAFKKGERIKDIKVAREMANNK